MVTWHHITKNGKKSQKTSPCWKLELALSCILVERSHSVRLRPEHPFGAPIGELRFKPPFAPGQQLSRGFAAFARRVMHVMVNEFNNDILRSVHCPQV